jgi:hypothetical protein
VALCELPERRRELKKDPKVIRPGDRVRVITPLQVIRCGYPKEPKDYLNETEKAIHLLEMNLFQPEQVKAFVASSRRFPTYARRRLADRLSWALCMANGYGGSERTIHTQENLELLKKTFTVASIRTAMTGRYYPPSGGYNSYTGDSDWEPGGLANMKSHRIAKLAPEHGCYLIDPTTLPEVEVIHLEKLKENEP